MHQILVMLLGEVEKLIYFYEKLFAIYPVLYSLVVQVVQNE